MNKISVNNRRNFIRTTVLGAAAAAAAPLGVMAAPAGGRRIALKQGDVILFQGDSITDAGRKKDNKDANSNSALGTGYAFMATADLLRSHAGKGLSIYNRGISGNKVHQLAARWQADCIELKPTVLSILIGVNDFWHTLVNGYAGTLETYLNDYRKLLTQTKQALPDVRLVIGEPFAVKGIKSVDDKWYPAFNDYRAAARTIAGEFDAVFIPYQKIFDEAQKKAPGAYWTYDGVHTTVAGARLMADAWLAAVK